MTRQEMVRALIAVRAALETGEAMDKPRATALGVAKGSKAKPRHIAAVYRALVPLLEPEPLKGIASVVDRLIANRK